MIPTLAKGDDGSHQGGADSQRRIAIHAAKRGVTREVRLQAANAEKAARMIARD